MGGRREPMDLRLAYGGSMFMVRAGGLGAPRPRKGNDVVIASTRASRVHARIFGRQGNFVIADQSSNGTFGPDRRQQPGDGAAGVRKRCSASAAGSAR